MGQLCFRNAERLHERSRTIHFLTAQLRRSEWEPKGSFIFLLCPPFFFFSKGSQMPEAGKINFFLMLILRWRTVMDSVAPAIRKDGTGPLTGIAAV